jgi:hypothetical protein
VVDAGIAVVTADVANDGGGAAVEAVTANDGGVTGAVGVENNGTVAVVDGTIKDGGANGAAPAGIGRSCFAGTAATVGALPPTANGLVAGDWTAAADTGVPNTGTGGDAKDGAVAATAAEAAKGFTATGT